LQYENVGNTFTNSKGCDCSEIDYFIHNIPQQQIIAEKAIIQIDTNTSDHYQISMSLKWEHNKDDKLMTPNPK
jgi:outer membrane receptor for monomeric catechols